MINGSKFHRARGQWTPAAKFQSVRVEGWRHAARQRNENSPPLLNRKRRTKLPSSVAPRSNQSVGTDNCAPLCIFGFGNADVAFNRARIASFKVASGDGQVEDLAAFIVEAQ